MSPCRGACAMCCLAAALLVLTLGDVNDSASCDKDSAHGDCAASSRSSFLGAERSEVQSLLGHDVSQLELLNLVAHGESGFVWRARRKDSISNATVIVKFRCCKDLCEGDRVCRGEKISAGMRHECEAGLEALARAPSLVAACDMADTEPLSEAFPPFIVLRDVPSYVNAQNSLELFIRQQQQHPLLAQLLRAVHAFLDPSREGRSLVHMDLTSANVMWDPQTLKLQVIDFSQVVFCTAVVAERSGVPGHCLPKHFLKDLKKELVHLALLADVYGSRRQDLCFKRVRKINFEKRRAQRSAADEFVPKVLGKSCASLISPWTWNFLTWMGHLDRHLLNLTKSRHLIPVSEVFQVESDELPPWSLQEMAKIYS